MTATLVLFAFLPVLVAILLGLNLLFAVSRPDAEKISSYECGFTPVGTQARAPFTIAYYLVGLLFLVFDLEIAVVFPLAASFDTVGLYGYWVAAAFLAVLTIGFVYEWGRGALNWTDKRSAISAPSSVSRLD